MCLFFNKRSYMSASVTKVPRKFYVLKNHFLFALSPLLLLGENKLYFLFFGAVYFLWLLQVHWSGGEPMFFSVFSLATYSLGKKHGILSIDLGSALWWHADQNAATSVLYFWQWFWQKKPYLSAKHSKVRSAADLESRL